MDTMSRGTSEAFSDVVTWASEQPWSTGKVGLLGISYYAGTQWRVAARKPKGLAAIVPWEGMSDYYRDRCRHGGIYSSTFISTSVLKFAAQETDKWIDFWWNGQVKPNQYGRPRRPGSKIPTTIEGTLSEEELNENLQDQTVDNRNHRFMDEDYYASRDFKLEDIEVPLLSVANWVTTHKPSLKERADSFTGWKPSSSSGECSRLHTCQLQVQISPIHSRST
jgi:putative CocE/NonD family hydrolase